MDLKHANETVATRLSRHSASQSDVHVVSLEVVINGIMDPLYQVIFNCHILDPAVEIGIELRLVALKQLSNFL